jgi:hypothetical protein
MLRFRMDPQGGPMPPGLAAMLGGGPAAEAGGPPGGNGAAGQAEDPEFSRLIKTAIDALHQAQATGEDDTDKQLAAECMAKLQGLLGTHQKQRDAALGMTDVHRGVRRAIRANNAGAGGGAGY